MPNLEVSSYSNQEVDKPRDHCAVVGMISTAGRDVAPFTKLSLHAQQNRGENGSGIAVFDGFAKNFRLHKDLGLVADALTDEVLKSNQISGTLAVGHNRYPTSGDKEKEDKEKKQCLQPYVVSFDRRSLAIAHNGNIPERYLADLRNVLPPGIPFQSDTDSEVIAWRIMFAEGESWKEKIANGLSGVKGAYSFVIATDEGDLFGVKDPQGIRPLTVAQTSDGYALVSETRGLEYMSGEIQNKREVNPGEMIHIDRDGKLEALQLFSHEKTARCVVESIYLKHPYSRDGDREVRDIRRLMGEALAREFPVPEDVVIIGVPDSGLEIGDGYARALGRMSESLIKKDRYRPNRTFMNDPDKRDSMLELKFTISDDVKDRKIVIIDDSVIRGKTTTKLISALRERGASEVHVLSGSPQFVDICDLGVDIATLGELQALKKNGGPDYVLKSNEEIASEIGADSIDYLSLDGLIDAIGGNETDFCTNCLTRQHPIDDLPPLEADRIYTIVSRRPAIIPLVDR